MNSKDVIKAWNTYKNIRSKYNDVKSGVNEVKSKYDNVKSKYNELQNTKNSIVREWRSAHKNNKDKESLEEDYDNQYLNGLDDIEGFANKWRFLKGKQRELAKELAQDLGEESRETLKKTSRIITYELYRLAWLNLIDTFGLTFLYLIFHFFKKYFAFDYHYCKFTNPFASRPFMYAKLMIGFEGTHYGWLLLFLVLFILLIILSFILIIVMLSPIIIITGVFKEISNIVNGVIPQASDLFGGGTSGGGGAGGSF